MNLSQSRGWRSCSDIPQRLLQLAEGNSLTSVQGRPTKALLAEDFINPINRFVTWLPSAVLPPQLFCVNGAHRRVLD